jgi:anti-sigma factor RsiW
MNSPTPPPDNDQLAWQAQRDALRELHREVLAEPVPKALLAAAGQLEDRRPGGRAGRAGAGSQRAC